MKLRKLKRIKQAQMAWILVEAIWQRLIDKAMEPTAEDKARSAELSKAFWDDLSSKMSLRSLVEPTQEEAAEKLAAKVPARGLRAVKCDTA